MTHFQEIAKEIKNISDKTPLKERKRLYRDMSQEILQHHSEINKFVLWLLDSDLIDDGFYMQSVDNHVRVKEETGPGGILKHSCRVLKLGMLYSNLYNLTFQEVGVVLAGAILHDIFKYWNEEQNLWLTQEANKCHAKIAAKKIEEYLLNNNNIHSPYNGITGFSKELIDVIKVHTNRFEPHDPISIQALSPVQQVFIIADYSAATLPIDL